MAEGSAVQDAPSSHPQANAVGQVSFLDMQDGRKIAYDQHLGSSPALVYIHGLGGDMDEPPSTALGEYCRQRDISFLKFDLAGHGQSSGPFEDCTVSRWLDDIEFLINTLTSEHLILVGNDIGSWLMFLYTMRNPDRIFGLVGLATAADFTGLLWKQLSKVEKDEVKRTGFYSVGLGDGHPPVKLSLELIMDGEKHSILDMPGLEIIQSATWLLHGDKDTLVPSSIPLQLMQKLQCSVELKLIEDGSHWLYRSEDFNHLLQAVDSLLHPSPDSNEGLDDD